MPRRLALPALPVLALLLAATAASAQAPPSRPNVVVLFVDDMGYGDLGSYGSVDALTPHLDALAARGLRFTDFYAGGPVCTPSRYALLTGLHTFRLNDPTMLGALGPNDRAHGIDAASVTVAEAFRDGGYETALIGKWHLGFGQFVNGGDDDTEYHPAHHGFDYNFGPLRGGVDYNTHWYRNGFLDWWEGYRLVPEDSLRYATHVFGERAEAFLDAHAGAGTSAAPFFLYLPFTAPHYGQTPESGASARLQLPLGREREYLARFDDRYADDANPRKRYLAMVAVLDDEVARITAALERNGLAENTVVWVISDNGGALDFGASNGVLRGGKAGPYEGGIRVPSFVVWPGRVAPGVTAQVAGNVDVMPTLLALAGLGLGHAVDGVDLSTFILGGPGLRRGIAVPNARLGDAYRLGRWKLVRKYDDDIPRPAELYDLADDLAEQHDLAAVYPDTLLALLDRLPYGRAPGTDPAVPMSEPDDFRPLDVSLRLLPNPGTRAAESRVELALVEGGPVRVEVFDARGRRLAVLHDGTLAAGRHRLPIPRDLRGFVVVRATGPFGTRTVTGTRLR